MPLVPFKLFSDETRLIVHNGCLYKLKLSNKSDISPTEISSFQRDEMNTELTKVIRAILFMIKVEKIIPRKICTPFFTVCVAIKFWKIALKLGFSKNGSRLKCGHLIELMLYMKESRILKEDSEVSVDSPVESDAKNENVQQFGHMALRQFVIDSESSESESNSCNNVVPTCKSPEHSKSAPNEDSNIISINSDGTKKTLVENPRIPDSLHNQSSIIPDQRPMIPDQRPMIPEQRPMIPDQSSMIQDQRPMIPDQRPMIPDQTAHTQITSDSAQTFDKHPHLSAPPKETIHPVQVSSIFVSSCTQTDLDELDLYANNPDPHPEKPAEAVCYAVYSDHNYLKSGNSSPNQNNNNLEDSNITSTLLQKSDPTIINQEQSSVSNLNPSHPGDNHNEDIASSASDDNDVAIESPGPVEFIATAVDKEKIENLNSEPEDTCLDSLTNESDTDCQDQNDVWGIESRTVEVVSEVEVPMESTSENSQDESVVNSEHKHLSEEISNQYREKSPEKHPCVEQAAPEVNSSDTERKESSTEKRKRGRPAKPKSIESSTSSPKSDRALRSGKKRENVRKLRSSSRTAAICPPKKSSSHRGKKPQAKKTPKTKKSLQSVEDTLKRSNQDTGIPHVPAEISFGLHDRYKVQSQDMQEDLKLQNLANPSPTSTKRKEHSFFGYLNFSRFLRSSKRVK